MSLALNPSKTSFIPHHTTTGKGIAYIRPFDLTLPLRPVEIELRITDVAQKFVTHQTVLLNFNMAMKLHILMPDQRA